MSFISFQIDTNVPKYKSLWLIICNKCQCENTVTYKNHWITQKTKALYCINCNYRPKKHKKNGRSLLCFYRNLFDQPSLNPKTRLKQRLAKLGLIRERSNRWKGTGYVNPRKIAMRRDEYKQLRKFVFSRDLYTCQICNQTGGKLEMDHIKEWCNYPELRYEPTNCRTLCKSCHKQTDNYGNKALKLKRAAAYGV